MLAELKNIKVKTEYPRRTLGSDMRLINVEELDRFLIDSRLEERSVFGIAPKSKIRSFAITANCLNYQLAKLVSTSLILIEERPYRIM